MIVSRIQGGLGNQMFQYACGRALSFELKTNHNLDLSWYENDNPDTPRTFELGIFSIPTKKISAVRFRNTIVAFNQAFPFIQKLTSFKQSTLEEFSKLGKYQTKNIYLDGYWNNERYFIEFESTIRSDFTFKKPHASINPWIKKIQESHAVSLHVRRGDYAHNPKTQAFHGLLPLSYYKEAITRIASIVTDPTFFVFSDDLEWVKMNLKSNYKIEFVSHNGKDYEDMRLMSLCKHHIIANSTFSWWGAWLNPSKDKAVIAPERWFVGSPKSALDIVPKTWIRL